jgi:hypothetical protein
VATNPTDVQLAEIIGVCLQQMTPEGRKWVLYSSAKMEAFGWYKAQVRGDSEACTRIAKEAADCALPVTFNPSGTR